MKTKPMVVLVLVLSLTLLTSGCIDFLRRGADRLTGGECIDLEKEIQKRPSMDCKCYPTDFVPDGLNNSTGLEEFEGKCYCTCSYEETDKKVNVSIVEGPDGERIVSTVS